MTHNRGGGGAIGVGGKSPELHLSRPMMHNFR
jgi:hypothetical protein